MSTLGVKLTGTVICRNAGREITEPNAVTSAGVEKFLRRAVGGTGGGDAMGATSYVEIYDSGGSLVRTLDPAASNVSISGPTAPFDGRVTWTWTDNGSSSYDAHEIQVHAPDDVQFNSSTIAFGTRDGASPFEVEFRVDASSSNVQTASAAARILEPLAGLTGGGSYTLRIYDSSETSPADSGNKLMDVELLTTSWDSGNNRVTMEGSETNSSGSSIDASQYELIETLDTDLVIVGLSALPGGGTLGDGGTLEATVHLSES